MNRELIQKINNKERADQSKIDHRKLIRRSGRETERERESDQIKHKLTNKLSPPRKKKEKITEKYKQANKADSMSKVQTWLQIAILMARKRIGSSFSKVKQLLLYKAS